MNELLALKYRPAKFSELIGQQRAVKLLQRSVQLKRYFPCYLISGPFGAGKTSIARIFSQAVLCERPEDGEPCSACSSCREFEAATNPNYSELDSASHGSVEDIRRLRDEANYKPFGGRDRRVVYLDEAGSITRAGNNAFLKLLEEGSDSVIFVMTTTDPDNILDTVKSRAFEIELNKISPNDIFSRLEHVIKLESIEADEKALRLIASYSQGHMRDALMLLDQMRLSGPITEQVAREQLKVDTKVEFLRLLYALGSGKVSEMVELLSVLETRLTPIEIWKGVQEAVADCYMLYRSVTVDLDAVEIGWAKRVIDLGSAFITTALQTISQLQQPHSQIEERLNLIQLAERCGQKTTASPGASRASNLYDLARKHPTSGQSSSSPKPQ